MSFIMQKSCGIARSLLKATGAVRSARGQCSANATTVNPAFDAYKPNNFERRFLVWTGKYSTMAEVPVFVSPSTMERSRSQMRIRTVNLMMAFTFIATAVMMWSGKKAASEGQSLQQQNLEWHRQYNEGKIDANSKAI